ncbi:MAG: hypothetical protein KG003_09070 [Bacteroidetes bacterium]|nr:hypothetical protein [Bacteroidota bacterium]
MKKNFILISIALSLVTCTKVLKDVHDYYPKLKMVSATVLDDGSVEVTGEVLSSGNGEMDFMGFCTDTNSSPEMLDMQINEVTVKGSKFTATYPPDFELGTKYYFRCWGNNGFGYAYSNIISLDSIRPLDVTAPCNPTINTVNAGTIQGNETYSSFQSSSNIGYWQIDAYSNSNILKYKFYTKPKTGIYTTTTNFDPGMGGVYVSNTSGFSSGTLTAGSKVYVNQYQTGKWEITICSAPIKYGSASVNFTTHFKYSE